MNWLQRLLRRLHLPRSVARLASWLALPESELREWMSGRPPDPRGWNYTYNTFTIAKRNGGTRTIHAPSEALKSLQRRILHRLFNPLSAHPAATGFVPGRSVVDNARPHVGSDAVINIDLTDFFHSIPADRVRKAFRALGWNGECAKILTNICTYEGRLPQGAPTSPALSNLVCRRLDERLSALIAPYGGHYTRYADDITVSFPAFGRNQRLRPKPKGRPRLFRPSPLASRRLLSTIRRIIESEGFTIQMKKKVRVQRPHQRQTATGLVINRTVNLPRAVRRRVRAMQHRRQLSLLDATSLARLRGWEALLQMVAHQRRLSATHS